MPLPLDELVQLAAHGDQKAFAEFYDQTKSRVFGVALRVIIDRSQAEEVTQDVYLELWRTAAKYDPTVAGALSWALTITHRRAIDRVRASQASRNRDLAVGVRDFPLEYDHVSEEVEVHSEFQRARAALERVTSIQREVIGLAYFDGLSQAEIAERLGVKVGTVKTRLRDGLMKLRAEMGELVDSTEPA
jgi:RNA polymerase sigma-70 factor (ECF subfamily)